MKIEEENCNIFTLTDTIYDIEEDEECLFGDDDYLHLTTQKPLVMKLYKQRSYIFYILLLIIVLFVVFVILQLYLTYPGQSRKVAKRDFFSYFELI